MNRKTFYTTIGGGIALLFCIVLLLLWNSIQKPVQTIPSKAVPNELERSSSQSAFASITIKDLTLKELEKNKDLEVIVNAKECNFLQSSDIVECSQVTCTLLDHKVPSAHLVTDKAHINRTQKNIYFPGAVQGNMKDFAIDGASINYDFSQQTLQTNQNTIYTHPDFKISSQKSFIDIKNNRIELSGGVINEFILHDKQQ